MNKQDPNQPTPPLKKPDPKPTTPPPVMRWTQGQRYTDSLQSASLEVRLLDALRVAEEPVSLYHLSVLMLANCRETRRALQSLQDKQEVLCTPEGTYTLFGTTHGHRARLLEALLAATHPLSCATLQDQVHLEPIICHDMLEELCLQRQIEAHRSHVDAYWLRGGRLKVQMTGQDRLSITLQDWMGRAQHEPLKIKKTFDGVYLLLAPTHIRHLRAPTLEHIVQAAQYALSQPHTL